MTPAVLTPEVRLAERLDLARVAPFLLPLGGPSFAERFGDGTIEDFYRWKYFGNPLGEAIVGIATAGEAVVSVVAATPKRILISGTPVVAYELGDFLTDESYRKRGLFSQLIERVCSEVTTRSPLVYVRPNENSYPILANKLGFREVQRIDARRFVIPSHTIARKTGVPVGLLQLTGMDWFVRSRSIPRVSSGVRVVSVTRFENEIDQLWQRASSAFDFALVRDHAYLNWRFAECPTPYTMWRAEKNGQSTGYIVTSAERGAPVAAIVDLFAEAQDDETVRALVSTAMNHLLESGVQLISTWTLQSHARSAAHRILQRAIPMPRKQHLHLVFKNLGSQPLALPETSQNWHFTLGDCDGS